MNNIYNWKFSDGSFEAVDIPELDMEGGDWDKMLSDAGFEHHSHFGSRSSLEITIYTGRKDLPWLLDIWAGNGICCIVCDHVPDLLKFLRDWAAPLLQIGRDDALVEFINTMESTLFDPELGLPAVQRVTQRNCETNMRNRRRQKLPTGLGKAPGNGI